MTGHTHVGIIAPEFPPDLGGIETHAFEYAKELATRTGLSVTVFTHPHPGGEIAVPGAGVRPVLKICRRADRLALLSNRTIDVWHVMNSAYAWLALETDRVLVSVHGNDFLRPYYAVSRPYLADLPLIYRIQPWVWRAFHPLWTALAAPLVRKGLPKAHHIFVNSLYTEGVLLEKIPACAGKTSVEYAGVAERFFGINRTPGHNGTARLLTVCRLSEARKNVDLVLRALARLMNRYPFSYTIVGDGHRRPALERLSDNLGLKDRVRFTGRVDQETLERAYGEADLFILTASITPNSHEGLGLVYLEAAAGGVPSLAARLAGAAEAVREGVSGMFVEEPTVSAITAALERFLGGAVRFDSAACRRFAKGFSWKRVVDCVLPYYR